jgi:hypothetical protein
VETRRAHSPRLLATQLAARYRHDFGQPLYIGATELMEK